MSIQHPVTYAQNREDILLDAFFDPDETGFYVDIGAEAPTELSVTKLFYDRGWCGINVEPIKRQHQLFVKERPRDINLNIGIAAKAGVLQFREYEGSGYSTFSSDMKKEHLKDDENLVKGYTDYSVDVLSLKDIFKQYAVTSIQFLKVDVEGMEYEVLAGNDWGVYRPEVLCIEANHVRKDWRLLLKTHGYTLVFFDGLNEYYTDSRTDRADRFNYVKSVVFKEPIVNFRILDEYEEYDKLITWLDDTNKKLKKELELAQEQVQLLSAALHEVTPLKRHIVKSVKRQVIKVDAKVTRKLSYDKSFAVVAIAGSEAKTPEAILKAARASDEANFAAFNAFRKDNPLLPAYNRSKATAHRTARKLLHKVFRG